MAFVYIMLSFRSNTRTRHPLITIFIRFISHLFIIIVLSWILLRAFQVTIGIGLSDQFINGEIWLFTSLFYLIYFNLKSNRWRFGLAYCLAFIPCLFFNLYYAYQNRVFKLTEFFEVPELITFALAKPHYPCLVIFSVGMVY